MNLLASLALSAAIVAAAQNDIPHNGDTMVVAERTDAIVTAVDEARQIRAADGSVSVIVLLAFNTKMLPADAPFVGVAGRISFNCAKRSMRITSSYMLDKTGTIVDQGSAKDIDKTFGPIRAGGNAEAIAQVVCGKSLHSTAPHGNVTEI